MGKTQLGGIEGQGQLTVGTAVAAVPQKGKAPGGKLHADLMAAPGNQRDLDKAEALGLLQSSSITPPAKRRA